MSSLNLIVGGLEEDWEELFFHEIHGIVVWFHDDITESFGGLFEQS